MLKVTQPVRVVLGFFSRESASRASALQERERREREREIKQGYSPCKELGHTQSRCSDAWRGKRKTFEGLELSERCSPEAMTSDTRLRGKKLRVAARDFLNHTSLSEAHHCSTLLLENLFWVCFVSRY